MNCQPICLLPFASRVYARMCMHKIVNREWWIVNDGKTLPYVTCLMLHTAKFLVE